MSEGRLIVLAEDNTELRGLLAAALAAVGYRVVQAATGEDLITEVRTHFERGEPPSVIVTDVRMPTLGGIAAAHALRTAGHSTPLIFMTAYGDAWTRSRATDLGAILLDKPLSLRVLRDAVKLAIGEYTMQTR